MTAPGGRERRRGVRRLRPYHLPAVDDDFPAGWDVLWVDLEEADVVALCSSLETISTRPAELSW